MTPQTINSRAAELAQLFHDAFEVTVLGHPNELGSIYQHRLRPDSPGWMRDALEAAHGSRVRIPNNWIARQCYYTLVDLAGRAPAEWLTVSVREASALGVDLYDADRARWLASDPGFFVDVDRAVRRGHIPKGCAEDLAAGQRRAARRIAYTIIDAILAEAGLAVRFD